MKRLPPWDHWPKHLQLLLILMTVTVIGWARFHGISLEGDPAAYAKLAYLDAQGLPPWAEWTFTARKGLIAPTSFFLSMTGPQLWAFVIWPWICLLLLSLFIWWTFEGLLQFCLLLLLLLSPWPSAYGLQLLPDFPMLAFSMMALMLLPHLRSEKTPPVDWVWGIGFTISLVIAGLCKLTMLYLLPGVAGLAIYDLLRRQHLAFWTAAFVAALSILGISFLFEEWNIILRINQMETDHNSSPFSYSWNEQEGMHYRLIIEPVTRFFANPGVGILLFPAMVGMLSEHRYAKPTFTLLIYLLVFHWVGTTSLIKYSPIPADPRMWILLSGPLLLLAAIGLTSLQQSTSTIKVGSWVILMALFSMIGLVFKLPGVLFSLLGGLMFIPIHRLRKWTTPGFGFLLTLWLGYHVFNKDNQYYQQQEIQLLLDSVPEGSMVYADTVLTFSAYLYEAKGVNSIVTWPGSIPQETLDAPQFFLWNGRRISQSNLYEERISIPAYIDDIRSNWELIGTIDDFAIHLYQLPTSDL